MPFVNEDLCSSVQSIWGTMLDTPIEASSHANCAALGAVADQVSCLVQISGLWNGSVVLSYNARLAESLTQIMFCMEDEAPSTDDVYDAIGELANMVGGNLKSVIGDPTHLSLPTVVRGNDYDLHVMRSKCTRELFFECLGECVRLRIFEPNEA